MPTFTPTETLTPTETAPIEACRFDASIEIAAGGQGKTKPVKIRARGPDAVQNWYFGRIVHDMSGMQLDKPTIPIDYCHDPEEVLGFADKIEAGDDGLAADGQLVPFVDDDRASEVIYKSGLGVPYQGSIFFDPYRLVLEQVGDGMTVEVNGGTFAGPGVVARKWVLRGIAVCPYGIDPDSDVEFSRRKQIVDKRNQEPGRMSTAATPETKAAAETKPATEAKTPEQIAAEKKTTDNAAAKSADEAPAGGNAAPAAAAPAAAGQQSAGQRFVAAFGAQGAVWFVEGLSFEESQVKFQAQTAEKAKALEKENGELKTQLAALRGEKDPLSFQNGEPSEADKSKAKFATHGASDGMAAFAASIKLPA